MILMIALMFAGPAYGQIVPGPEDLYLEASEYMLAGEYQEALSVLLNLREKGFYGANISYRIGECYLNLKGQKTKAIPHLKEAVQKISGTYSGDSLPENAAPVKSILFLGIAYRINNDFSNALSSFGAYIEALDISDVNNRSLAQYHIERCLNALELIAAPARIRCDTLPDMINSAFSNYNPLVSADEKQLFFMDQLKFYDAVMNSNKLDTAWQKPENLTPRVKSDGDHVLTGLSIDGKSLLLNAYDPYMSGDIYLAEYINRQWSGMSKLNENINTRFNETHASFSPDGKYLYFTSDRKGGFGGLDIYRSSRDNQGNWDAAENLGPLVNSPYNEESPFLTGDGKTLFFSSQGHYNMGGYDIFMSGQDGRGWLPPVNVGFPLNTTDDDLFFFPLGSGRTAYVASILPGSAQQDIVRYTIFSFGHPSRFMVTGKVNQQTDPDQKPESLTVAFVDNETRDTISIRKISLEGSYAQKLPAGSYTLVFSGKDTVYLCKKLDIPAYFPQEELVLNTDLTIHRRETRDTFAVEDILFEFDKSSLSIFSQQYLDKVIELMSAYSGLHLCVNGYADACGKETYNMKLSLLRANVVAAYLNRNNSLSGRISVKAYGEKKPVARNQSPNGHDNPLGRKYNRRVELEFDNFPENININKLNSIPVDLRIK
jgi:outer membrane protein OmpA-like peptidoglycan-associated protein/tetratricopeptide (TPR) repeat protein